MKVCPMRSVVRIEVIDMKMETYKEYEIHVESNGSFEALKEGEVVFREDTLKVLKEEIDKESKQKVRQPCLVADWGEIHEGTITSVIEQKSGYGAKTFDVWVSWERNNGDLNRGKKAFYDLYKPTEGNKKLFAEIEVLKLQAAEIAKAKESLEKKLIHFSAKDFGFKEEI